MQTKIGASGILYLDGNVLLGRRELKDTSLPGLWCSPGGGIEWQETINHCIAREFYEEVCFGVQARSAESQAGSFGSWRWI